MDYKNRKDMRKITVAIVMALAIQVAVTSCQREEVQREVETPEEEPPYTIGDWEDGGTIQTRPDSVRDATHEDSIRFGLI